MAISTQGIDAKIDALRDGTKKADPLLIEGFISGMRGAYGTSAAKEIFPSGRGQVGG